MSSTTPTPTRRPSRLVKATAAGAVGLALLAAGGGTFARWYDSAPIASAATISQGELNLTDEGAGSWTQADGTPVKDVAAFTVVPGDTLTFTQSVKVHAKGDNLKATLTTNAGEVTAVEGLQVSQVFTVNGVERAAGGADSGVPLTAADDGALVGVTVTVTFPEFKDPAAASSGGDHAGWWGTAAQNGQLSLQDLTVVVEQDAR
ncbi:alternate-type signal peptide domain-containing protein [Georgenia sp. TF02-10]|uniref:alternate-type signal peptide domain-containing protein n=1 Tax=Georgenia sp. TF02-10 TaxID=2917725 RepID=UPI001FA7840B|nr:alternate-type signal peptide domain-containing protein [Georgenia sp. TF02-10]UNX55352.1 alternate-type signal peptide domain-containing protein [Georgenia sp. TF02-10]